MGFIALVEGKMLPVGIERDRENRATVTIDGREHVVDARWTQENDLSLIIDGRSYQVDIHTDRDLHKVMLEGQHYEFELFDERKTLLKRRAGLGAEGVQEIKSSMPGKIVKVLAGEGEEVAQGQGLVVVEAMKMENEIKSPKAGVVKKVGVREGETVEAGALLIVVE